MVNGLPAEIHCIVAVLGALRAGSAGAHGPCQTLLVGTEYNGVAPLWRSSSRPCSMRLGMLASSSHPCVAQTWSKWEYLPPARRGPSTLLSYPVQCRLTALFLSMALGAEYPGSSSPEC